MVTNNVLNTRNPLLQYLETSTTSLIDVTTSIPRDDTIPQNTEGQEILTLTITPQRTTSKLIVKFSVPVGREVASNNSCSIALFQDASVNALAATGYRLSFNNLTLEHVMTSGTTSATTFKIRFGLSDGAHVYLNGDDAGNRVMGGVSKAVFTIEEYFA